MSKKFIQNLTNGRVLITDDKGNMIITLQPYQCSITSFEEDVLYSYSVITKMLNNKWISLQNEKTQIKLPEHKNYGQKYKIGTKCFLNDASKLELVIESYNPNNGIYSAKIIKTGGLLKIQEAAISLTEPVEQNKKINIDIDEYGNLKEESTEQPIPQQPSQEQSEIEIVRTNASKEDKSAKSADEIIKSVDAKSREIANQQVEIVYKTPKVEKPVEDESTFIVKADKDIFAKEISASKLTENTQKVVVEELKKVTNIKPQEESRSASIDEQAFVELEPEMQQYISSFMLKDARVKKITISKCKDINKLTAISKCADEVSKKGALAKLEKLNVK